MTDPTRQDRLVTSHEPRAAPASDVTTTALASLRRSMGIEYALTLWPEWAWAIAELDKRVENRGWRLPASMLGTRIAIHAGASIGGRKGAPATREGIEAVATMAHFAGWYVSEGSGFLAFAKGEAVRRLKVAEIHLSAIVCTAVLASCTEPSPVRSEDGWYIGEFGFRLADVQVLPEPIHCAGAQGFWRLP